MEDSGLELLTTIQHAPPEIAINLVYSVLGEVAKAGKHFARYDAFERLSSAQLNKAIESAEQAKIALTKKDVTQSSHHLRETLSRLVPYVSEFDNIDEGVGTALLATMTFTALALCNLETKLSKGYNTQQISYQGLTEARAICASGHVRSDMVRK